MSGFWLKTIGQEGRYGYRVFEGNTGSGGQYPAVRAGVYIGIKSRQGFVINSAVKLTFGRWLAMALEFQLAADILNTTVDPDIEGLIKLFGIALIRTFLNYFLTKEIEMQAKPGGDPELPQKRVASQE